MLKLSSFSVFGDYTDSVDYSLYIIFIYYKNSSEIALDFFSEICEKSIFVKSILIAITAANMSSLITNTEVKTFRAANMQEAIRMVRDAFGPDAAVISAKQIKSRRFFGLLQGEPQIEIISMPGKYLQSSLNSPPPSPAPSSSRVNPRQAQLTDAVFSATVGMNDVRQAANEFGQSPWDSVMQGFQQHEIFGSVQMTSALYKAYTSLIDADISELIARELICAVTPQLRGEQLNDYQIIRQAIIAEPTRRIPVSGAIRPRHTGYVVALVGPTGVGKTTTIAKLAAHYSLKERLRVGLITVDTYRIAAVEQLRAYANIIDLPMLAVRSVPEMIQAVSRLRNLDLILMDTAGRGTKEDDKIHDLKTYLDAASADEVHLTLSGSSAARSLCRAAETFSILNLSSLVLTKLDEAVGLGNLLSLLRWRRLPLSYVTDGQSVPEDFQVANAAQLARLALGEKE
jgi:flagellar biosynthesis protein FlhF